MKPREHARLLGLLFLIYVGFQFVVSIFAVIVTFFMSGPMMEEISKMPRKAGEPNPEAFFGMFWGIMIFAFVFGFILLIPKLIAGYGLRTEKKWAKVWAIIACCLAVLNIPFGLALAIYGFWFIFGEQGKQYFSGANEMSQVPPPPNSWQ